MTKDQFNAFLGFSFLVFSVYMIYQYGLCWGIVMSLLWAIMNNCIGVLYAIYILSKRQGFKLTIWKLKNFCVGFFKQTVLKDNTMYMHGRKVEYVDLTTIPWKVKIDNVPYKYNHRTDHLFTMEGELIGKGDDFLKK